jgi:heme o synthase
MKPEVEELSDSRSGPLAFLAVALELTKPRLTLLVLISGACGWLAARNPALPLADLPWIDLLHLIIGLAGVGAASNIVNQAMEHRLDALMERTKDRPVPSGRISVMSTYMLGHVCLLIGMGWLLHFFQPAVAGCTFLTYLTYIIAYTPLKTRSSLNTLVGAVPGALPILTGWLANWQRPESTMAGLSLFAIVFFWQLPHFFAIASIYKDDYRRAGYRMASLYDPSGKQAVILIWISTIALCIISYAPFAVHLCGVGYLLGVSLLNAALIAVNISLTFDREKHMRTVFRASIVWLTLTMILIVTDLEKIP